MYAILRADIPWTTGLACSKAGQAFINAFDQTPEPLRRAYLSDGEGTQVVLRAPDAVALLSLRAELVAHDLPHAAVTLDDGTLIALGIGPLTREMARHFTKGLRCM